MSLSTCMSCGGFVPSRIAQCPNCRASPHRPSSRSLAVRLGLLAGPVGGGAIAMTLMACYGMPPCPDGSLHCYDTGPSTDAEPNSLASDGGLSDAPLASDGSHADAHPGANTDDASADALSDAGGE